LNRPLTPHPTAHALAVEKSLTGRHWQIRCEDDRLALAIAQRTGVPEIIGRVLAGRGVELEEAEFYLAPNLKDGLPDPSVLTDMDKAAARMADALERGEKIAVFGDYDVDGATSAAVLARACAALGTTLRLYIPDRMAEGYGPNVPAMRRLAQEGAKLIVTVDCGTMAHAAIAEGGEAGADVIVLDHHQAEPELPPAFAVVNPNRLDDTSGLGALAAVGVSYLFVIAVNRELKRRGREALSSQELLGLLDMVALGTVADVVPLTGLNRTFVAQGLKVLGQRRTVGLRALCDVARLDGKPEAYHMGFLLGPRVNAGGRVGEADLGVRLLTTEDETEAAEIARSLDRLNEERRTIEALVLEDATALAEEKITKAGTVPPLVMVAAEGWHPGVIGIVASRLKERFGRPALVIALDEHGVGKGSGRSVSGVDLGLAVTHALEAGLLTNGGGHKMAAGLTVPAEQLDALEAHLTERLAAEVARSDEFRVFSLDGVMTATGATSDLVMLLESAGPYGAGNPEPRFAFADMTLVNVALVGEAHVRQVWVSPEGARLKGIAFRIADTPLGAALLAGEGRSFHIAGRLKPDTWNGRNDVQIHLEDAALPTRAGGAG